MIILAIGGSGSGKSAWAERVIARAGLEKRYYIATMQAFDGESKKRVTRHRAQRAAGGFETLEKPLNVGEIRLAGPAAVLLEDLPNLLANEMFGGGNPGRILPGLESLARQSEILVIVSGNVFSDGIRYDESTQDYIRQLAALNSQIAQRADTVAEVVYSIPVALKGALPCV